MKKVFIVPPKAIRDERRVEESFRVEWEKMFEKYRLAQQIESIRKTRKAVFEDSTVDDGAETMGMYMTDAEQETMEKKGDKVYLSEGVMAEIIKYIKSMHTQTRFELKWKEFMSITVCLQVPLPYILRHIDMVYKWGALLVLVVYVFISVCIAMPIYMFLMFMGNYSRRSYIRFWECVPVLKGVAYSVALTTVLQEIFSVTFSSICLHYIVSIITTRGEFPWKNCNFPRNSSDCQAVRTTGYNKSCCIRGSVNCTSDVWGKTVFKFPAYDYFKSNQLQVGFFNEENASKGMPAIYFVMIMIIWVIIFVMMMVGLRRFRGFMTTINMAFLVIVIVPLVFITLYTSENEVFPHLKSDYSKLFNYTFWIEASTHSLHRELAGDVITFSAISSPGISTTIDTICIYTVKLLYLILTTVWISSGVTKLTYFFNIRNIKCIHVDGFMVMFGLFPELLCSYSYRKLILIIYFLIMFYWSFSSSIYALNSFIEALLEEYPRLVRLKSVVCGVFCLAVCCVNLLMAQGNPEVLYRIWISETYTQMKVLLLFFSLLGLFTYTLNRLSDDYHFSYGQKLSIFWIHGIKVAMLIITILTILKLRLIFSDGYVHISEVVIMLMMIVPIALGAIWVFFKYKSGIKKSLIDPERRWGPPELDKKIARSKFDPKRALRYKSTVQTCTHSCLLNSLSLNREIRYWENKLALLDNVHIH